MSKKHVAVIGATGQVGAPLTRSLLKEGHRVTAIVRGRNPNNELPLVEHEKLGAKVVVCADMQNAESVANALKGCDTLVVSVPASKQILQELEPIWLKAAIKAGVERFVPNEFGCHTRGSR